MIVYRWISCRFMHPVELGKSLTLCGLWFLVMGYRQKYIILSYILEHCSRQISFVYTAAKCFGPLTTPRQISAHFLQAPNVLAC